MLWFVRLFFYDSIFTCSNLWWNGKYEKNDQKSFGRENSARPRMPMDLQVQAEGNTPISH